MDENILESFDSQLNIFSKEQLFILCFSSSLIEKANKLYLYLKNRDYNIKLLEINDGEKHKGIDNVQYVLKKIDSGATLTLE